MSKFNGKTILFLGDSLLSQTTETKMSGDGKDKVFKPDQSKEDERNTPECVKYRTNATIINGAMSGARYKKRNESDSHYISDGEYVLKNLIDVFIDLKKENPQYKGDNNPIINDWNLVSTSKTNNGKNYTSSIQRGYYELKEWISELYNSGKKENLVDVIILGYGTNDWSKGIFFTDLNKIDARGKAYKERGSGYILKEMIQKIQTYLPEASILVLSPLWGQTKNGKTFEEIKRNDRNILYWIEEIEKLCNEKKVAFLNGYDDLQFSKDNRVYYSLKNTDGTIDRIHLNGEGSERYANIIIGKLITMLGIVSNSSVDFN